MNKPITEPGKGNYWVVDYSFGDGNKRVRKRNARPTKAEREQRNKLAAIAARREEEEESTDEEMDVDVPQPSRTPEPTSRVQIDDSNIDPELRNQGHIVGERRVRTSAGPSTRSDGRRANSPYAPSPPSSQSRPTSSIPRSSRPSVPRSTSASTTSPTTGPGTSSSPVKADYGPKIYTQSTLKLSARAIRQGSFARPTLSQATFGKPSLPAPSQAPNTRSPSTWAQYGSSAPVPYTGPATSATRDQSRASPRSPPPRRTSSSASDQAQDIRNAAIRRPTPRPGIEVVADPQGLVSARRVVTNASASQNSRPPAWSSNAPRSSRARESYSSRSGSSESESQD